LSSNRFSSSRPDAAPLPEDYAVALSASAARLGRLATSVAYFPVVASTNDVAAALANRGGCEGAVVIADEQTAGRGRRGREWYSPPGSGLYVSVVLAPGRSANDPDGRGSRLITLAVGVALVEGVQTATGLVLDLKWPNDLYAGARKLGGILAEGAGGGAGDSIVVGYGINVGLTSYPPALGDRATSLESELGRPVDRALVLIESLAALARRYDDLLRGRFDAILDAWRGRAPAGKGARVSWMSASGPMSGVTAGIDDEGALLVRVGDQMQRIIAGEVTWRPE
jgi:BirA family biotin operon repressor/biotin-[acetyl-CoA-carboxylase] ligase